MQRQVWSKFLIGAGLLLLAMAGILAASSLQTYAHTRSDTELFAGDFVILSATTPFVTMRAVESSPTAPLPLVATPTPTVFLEQATRLPHAITAPASASPANDDRVRPLPVPTRTTPGVAPHHIRIPSIRLDAFVAPISTQDVEIQGEMYMMWKVPNERVVGWHNTSARLGVPGNSVFNGHNTLNGEVFRDLYKLQPGDLIMVEGQNTQVYTYTVREKLILPEAGQSVEIRIQNAHYIAPTPDERVTLITCHPYGSLRNRLLIIAYPAPRIYEGLLHINRNQALP